jgi:hypothetical protein
LIAHIEEDDAHMSEDNVLSLEPILKAKAQAAAECRKMVDRSAEHFRILTRAVREMRERGASTIEIAHTLRTIAEELDSGGDRIA